MPARVAAPAQGAVPAPPSGHFRTRGHGPAVAAVARMLQSKPPHALLIGGPAGIGKTTLALDLAAGLLCDDPDPAARPCRACRGCRLVDRGMHLDVHRIAPMGPGNQIRIGSRDAPEEGTVRRLTMDLALTPVEGGVRVAIIERADRLGDDAQTALLKTLEEPPAGVTIILCADDEDRLMPTVRSRCARIRLGPVGVRDIEAILAEADLADPSTAARLARLSGGRPGLARSLGRSPDAVALRDEIARTLLDLLAGGPAARLSAARDLASNAARIDRALRAAASADQSEGGPPDASSTGAATRAGGRRPRSARATAPGAARAADAHPEAGAAGGGEAPDGDDDGTDDEGDGTDARAAAPAAERRRAAATLIAIWRDLARDLLVIRLGSEAQIRDPGLLDDLRVASAGFGDSGPSELGDFLRRLDEAGELLEGNVRAEMVLDTLLLAWPRASAHGTPAPALTR